MSDFEGQAAVDAADDETSVGTAVAMDDDCTKPRGWRHGATWTYLIMLLASAVALLVSFILSADTLKMARNPGQKLNCDVNAVLSCSTVAESWQAEIVKFAGLNFPNAFFGIAARIGVRDDRGDRTGQGGRAALVRAVHMAWRPCRAGVFVLADHAVAVRHQRDVPVVPGADVLHHRAVHGVVACHGGRAGHAVRPCWIAQVLPAEFRSDGRCGVDCGADRGHSRQGRPDAVRLIRFASSLLR